MRIVFILLICLSVISCQKEKQNCSPAIITSTALPCNQWGIIVDGHTYPSKNIPNAFKQDGLNVCTSFALYQDMALCPCCGGSFAEILYMK